MIGERIKKRRRERGLSQEKLGEACGLSQKQISKIERFGTDSIWKVRAIAKALHISLSELLEDEDPKS